MPDRSIMPGIRPLVVGEMFHAEFGGGSLEDHVLTLGTVYLGTCTPTAQTVTMVVETAAGTATQPVEILEWAFSDQLSYNESEGLARRLAISHHLETYRFSHWERSKRRFSRKVPVYRFVHARRLVPRPGARRWSLEMGDEVPLPARSAPMLEAASTWAEARAQAADAADAFHRAANLLRPFSLEDQLAQPRKVVEDCRVQAYLWAQMGEQLDALPPGEKKAEVQRDLMDRILSARQTIEDCVVLVAEIGAKAPAAYNTPVRREDGTIALMALAAGTDTAAQLGRAQPEK